MSPVAPWPGPLPALPICGTLFAGAPHREILPRADPQNAQDTKPCHSNRNTLGIPLPPARSWPASWYRCCSSPWASGCFCWPAVRCPPGRDPGLLRPPQPWACCAGCWRATCSRSCPRSALMTTVCTCAAGGWSGVAFPGNRWPGCRRRPGWTCWAGWSRSIPCTGGGRWPGGAGSGATGIANRCAPFDFRATSAVANGCWPGSRSGLQERASR